jgi:hypothetical protein
VLAAVLGVETQTNAADATEIAAVIQLLQLQPQLNFTVINIFKISLILLVADDRRKNHMFIWRRRSRVDRNIHKNSNERSKN